MKIVISYFDSLTDNGEIFFVKLHCIYGTTLTLSASCLNVHVHKNVYIGTRQNYNQIPT